MNKKDAPPTSGQPHSDEVAVGRAIATAARVQALLDWSAEQEAWHLKAEGFPEGRAWLTGPGNPFWCGRSEQQRGIIGSEWAVTELLASPEVQAVRAAQVFEHRLRTLGGFNEPTSLAELATLQPLHREWCELRARAEKALDKFWRGPVDELSPPAQYVIWVAGIAARTKGGKLDALAQWMADTVEERINSNESLDSEQLWLALRAECDKPDGSRHGAILRKASHDVVWFDDQKEKVIKRKAFRQRTVEFTNAGLVALGRPPKAKGKKSKKKDG